MGDFDSTENQRQAAELRASAQAYREEAAKLEQAADELDPQNAAPGEGDDPTSELDEVDAPGEGADAPDPYAHLGSNAPTGDAGEDAEKGDA